MKDDQRKSWERLYKRRGELWSRKHDEWFSSRDVESVLDLGCGTGKSIDGLRGRIVGVDFSVSALRAAKRKHTFAEFVAAEAARLPFRNGSFDLVRASYVFGHLDEAHTHYVVDEISRVMTSKGRLAIEVFSVRDGRYGKGEQIADNTYLDGEGIIHRFFELREVENLFSRFEKQDIELVEWNQRVGPRSKLRRSIIRAIFRKQ